MASIWMLSKDAMRGMDIVGAISEFLDEYQTKGRPTSESSDRVLYVIERLILGARSFLDSNVRIDSFSMMIAEAVHTEMSKTPNELISILERCAEHIRSQSEHLNDCLDILRIISKNVMRVTSRRVDTRSLVLH